MVVARLTAAGALDATYGGLGYRAANLDGASPSVYEVDARRLRVDADGTALVLSTVKSATGPATHLVGLARLTPAGALDAAFGTGGTRTQDVSPSHVTDMTSLVTLPDGFVVGGAMAVGSTTQFALAGYKDGTPTPLTPSTRRRNLVVGTGGAGPHRRAGRHAAGPPARGRHQPDAERAEPQRDRPPRRRRPRPAGRRASSPGSRPCPAARSGPARPSASTRPARPTPTARSPSTSGTSTVTAPTSAPA